MKKFYLKSLLFVIPFFALYVFEQLYFSEEGDLLRVGYVAHRSNYREVFKQPFNRPIHYTNFTDIDRTTKNKYTALIVGDSFSGGGPWSYVNYLSENDSITALHFDLIPYNNPLKALYGLLNGDLLKNTTFDFIILESAEKKIVHRVKAIDSTFTIPNNSLDSMIERSRVQKIINNEQNDIFFSDRIIKFSLYNLLYLLKDDAYFSPAYRVELKEKLFSNEKNELLLGEADFGALKKNNDIEAVQNLNKVLNHLAKKCKENGVKLIVLPGPDKLGMYYEYIVDNHHYPRPLFFEHLGKMPKDYIYVNSKQILEKAIKHKNDIYFYDDTHWSPFATKLIAEELAEIMMSR